MKKTLSIILCIIMLIGIMPMNAFAATKPSAPVISLTNVASSGKIKVSWTKVNSASLYEVYRATSKSGTYKKMVTKSTTSYINTSATESKTYYYKVRGVASDGTKGAFSSVKYRTCDLARPKVKATTSSKGYPKLTWAKISGAEAYKVYRATSKTGTYKLMKTVKSLSYVNTSAMAGKTYYYMVKAVCSKSAADSAYSAIVTVKAKTVQTTLRFLTGGESGTYYAFGAVIAQHATNNANIKVTALSSDGSLANICDISEGNGEIAICQSDAMTYAYNGTRLFEDTGKLNNFSVVAALYTEQVQIVTTNPDIKSVADLKGKSVSVGAPSSGTYFNAVDILGIYGLTMEDIKPTYQSFGDSTEAIKDGQIEAAFIVAGAPTTAVTELATSKAVYLVGLDDEHVNKLIEQSPYYAKCVIPAEIYKGVAEVITVGVSAVIIARNDVSEDAIYTFVKDIFDNAASLVSVHNKYRDINIEFGSSVKSVPYHPGAAKYFKEKGFTV